MRRSARTARAAAVCAGAAVTVLGLSSSTVGPGQPAGPLGAATAENHRGFALPAYSREGYRASRVRTDLQQMRAVGAGWVQINPTWYQNGLSTARIARVADTPSDASVRYVIEAAHRAGLKVLLKPLLDVLPDGHYRGDIKPTDRAAWFASYTKFIDHYARLAEQCRAEGFAVGTELAGVSSSRSGWLKVVRSVRARYSGLLLYAANFDEYDHVAFWDLLDLVGIDAYWSLSQQPTTDVNALRRAWSPILRQLGAFATRTGRRILFTEAGYTSQRGSTTAPWSWTISEVPDQAEQAAGYQALLASLSGQPWWAGVHWWAWGVPSDTPTDDPLDYSPRTKPAEAVVRQWWT